MGDDSLSHGDIRPIRVSVGGIVRLDGSLKHEQCVSTLFNINAGYACIMSPDIYIADHSCATLLLFIIKRAGEEQIFFAFLELILSVLFTRSGKGGRERSFGSIIDEQTRGKGYLLRYGVEGA